MAGFTHWLLFSYLLLLICGHGIDGARDVKPDGWNWRDVPRDLEGKFSISDFHQTVNIASPEKTSLRALVEKYSLRDHSHDNMENSKGGLFTKVADSIPFSSSKLPEILQLFSIPPGSSLAKAMEDTLQKCVAPGKGETKTCATSLESMVDFVSEIKSFRKVACHPMPYPYAVFFCQYDEDSSETRVFKVSMIGENTKDKVDAAAVCHMDSASAALLNLTDKQGKSPMCHFFSAGDLSWVQ
ncbi:BURP domain-containing-like protein [Theobroma cacao]|uniref:BURP domain-containing-like protein n=1 Tax=Theobroma cacao TaxID=3641 RepID=A0A061DX97_THECC|nr:BURP domain-containing-like protein [Theobroma cacao]